MFRRGLTFVVLLCIFVPSAAAGIDREKWKNFKSLGTGVLVNPGGYILTNRHVVDECTEFVVQPEFLPNNERNFYPAEFFAKSEKFDLAVLKAELPKNRPIASLLLWENYHVFIPKEGMRVAQGGYAYVSGMKLDSIKLSFGYVRKVPDLIEESKSPPDTHLLEASTAPGGSGSGIFDMHGNLIGIIYAVYNDEITQKLIEKDLWEYPNYGNPILFHGLNAIGEFLVENDISIVYQVAGKSKPRQGDAPIYGFIMQVTYLILCK